MPLSLADLRPEPRFRPATIDDAELLYVWRMKAEEADVYEGSTTFDEHLDWLRARLDNPLVHVLIWGNDQGMVRIDSNGEVAFHASDTGTAVAMLRAIGEYAAAYGGRLKATVDQRDWRGTCLVQAGFDVYPATFLCLRP